MNIRRYPINFIWNKVIRFNNRRFPRTYIDVDLRKQKVNYYASNRQKLPRKDLWKRDFEEQEKGFCFCCHKPITFKDFNAGHIVPDIKGGTVDLSNLLCICKDCNLMMQSTHLFEWLGQTKMPGSNFINQDNYYFKLGLDKRKAQQKLDTLKQNGQIKTTTYNKWSSRIKSTKYSNYETRYSYILNILRDEID